MNRLPAGKGWELNLGMLHTLVTWLTLAPAGYSQVQQNNTLMDINKVG